MVTQLLIFTILLGKVALTATHLTQVAQAVVRLKILILVKAVSRLKTVIKIVTGLQIPTKLGDVAKKKENIIAELIFVE